MFIASTVDGKAYCSECGEAFDAHTTMACPRDARELLALRARMRRYEEALDRIAAGGCLLPTRCVGDYECLACIAKSALATRTPEPGRAEPKTEEQTMTKPIPPHTCTITATTYDGRVNACAACQANFTLGTSPRECDHDECPPSECTKYGPPPREGAPACKEHDLANCFECPPAEPDEAKRWLAEYVAPFMPLQRPNMAQCSSLDDLVAAAREAGRVEGWDEAVKALRRGMYPGSADYLAARRPGGAAPDGRGAK